MRLILTFIIAVCFNLPAHAEEMPGWVEGKLRHMTLEEKVGQVLMISLPGPKMTEPMKAFLKAGKFGGLILF